MYIYKNYLTYKTCKNLLICKSKQLESIFIEIANKNGKKTIACCIYKNPTLSNQEFLENHMFPLLKNFISMETDHTIRFQLESTKLKLESYSTDGFYTYSFISYINLQTGINKHSETLTDYTFHNKLSHIQLQGT